MKHNLAKVLGLEQLTDERVTFNPSDNEIQEQEVKQFHQYLEDHQQATEVALESVGSAHAFGHVIQKNNSTDKTTYELLKVAVEQLKEKTGVMTQSVSLESLDSLSYKEESLQGVKNFISKVIEAIKKAFIVLVEKVKAFFKGLFDKDKSIQKEEKETIKQSEEFQKAESKVLALGYSPDIVPGVFEYGEKQPEYSGNFHKNENAFKNGDTYAKAYTSNVRKYLGWDARVSKHQGYRAKLTDTIKELDNLLSSISYEDKDFDSKLDKVYQETLTTNGANPVTVYATKDMLGSSIKIIRTGAVFSVEINSDDPEDLKVYPFESVSVFPGTSPLVSYIQPSGKLLEKSSTQMQRYARYLDDAQGILNLLAKKLNTLGSGQISDQELEEQRREALEYQREWMVRLEHLKSIAAALSIVHSYLQGFHSAVLLYVRETINLSVKNYVAQMKKSGRDVDADQFVAAIYGDGTRI